MTDIPAVILITSVLVFVLEVASCLVAALVARLTIRKALNHGRS